MASNLNPIALGVFGGYFGLILGLFGFICRDLVRAARKNGALRTDGSLRRRVGVMGLLAGVSFSHTWYYMFAFLNWSFTQYESSTAAHILAGLSLLERISNWTTDTALFEQAWVIVCQGPMNWWWSQQLCLYTCGAWTVFLYVESRRRKIPHAWAYMLLGQAVAISVATNLFYIAVILHPSPVPSSSSDEKESEKTSSYTPPLPSPTTTTTTTFDIPTLTVFAPVVVALAAVYTTPLTIDGPYALANILAMHGTLFVPLFSLPSPSTTSKSISWSSGVPEQPNPRSIRAVYLGITLLSLLIRLHTVVPIMLSFWELCSSCIPPHSGFFSSIWTSYRSVQTALNQSVNSTLYSHPAQLSIGYDIIWTSTSFFVWLFVRPREEGLGIKRWGEVVLDLVFKARIPAMTWLGIGVVAPFEFAQGK